MATISPFKAVRPTRDKVGLFATRTYLSYSKKGLSEKLLNNPFTFLQIINPDFNQKKILKGNQKFELIKKKYKSFLDQEIINKDKERAFYIYYLNHEGNKYKGIIASASTKEYEKGVIKKHEKTLKKREALFTEYLSKIKFNADPVLLSYKSNKKINNLIEKLSNGRAEYEFTTSNKALHKLWIISNSKDILDIQNEFKKVNSLYIADGHHRTESSYQLSKSNGIKHFMSLLIDENDLKIYGFNRVLKFQKEIDRNLFLKKLSENFDVKKISGPKFQTKNSNEIVIYFNKTFYSIVAKKDMIFSDSLSKLSYSILNKKIFEEIFNLDSNSKKIKYYSGKEKIENIIKIIDNDSNSIAFILNPIKLETIKEIADKNQTLPPKSTYIDPKLRSGITILDL